MNSSSSLPRSARRSCRTHPAGSPTGRLTAGGDQFRSVLLLYGRRSSQAPESPMSAAAISIAAYAVYLVGQGAVLLLVPNTILPILGLPQAADFWVRIVGMTVVFFAV